MTSLVTTTRPDGGAEGRVRARELGITVGVGRPGPNNCITDVAGVRVGHSTVTRGEGPLERGRGPVRTGVTVVLPHQDGVWNHQVPAGYHSLNGNGEMTGLHWIRECGTLRSPIGLTNTHSVGVVRDTLAEVEVTDRDAHDVYWSLPVVAETWDGLLNDTNGFHVRPEHVREALADATRDPAVRAPIAEGNVGSGTGMVSHGFKGGIGTASRVVGEDGFTVGVLVQANHGWRSRLAINGAPVGRMIGPDEVPLPQVPGLDAGQEGGGSVIVIVATDAPLLPHQCRRLAQRASLGIARTGGAGEHASGDLFLAFATGNRIETSDYGSHPPRLQEVRMLSEAYLDPLFHATIEATEEALVNCLVAAETMTGRDGVTVHALPHDRLVQALDRFGLREA
ncbi:P1 family peptidase [Nocardioides sp. LHG3406-4]|uniref:DmpA family aminopeptidase n=1 Tax=Nocardioides sp. LHG3406-4 TaxID=2804575 RepID=UPI003CF9AED8